MAKSIPWSKMGSSASRRSWLDKLIREDKAKARWFMSRLVKLGVPRSALATNDFHSSLTPKVYITIPYGRLGGGRSKSYQRWNDATAKSAVKFYKSGGR